MKANMAGYLLLAGGLEFGGAMVKPDLRALQLAGGSTVPIAILPTAVAPYRTHWAVGTQGIHWFRSLGARNIEVLPVIDKESANDADLAACLRLSRLIYIPGGFAGYCVRTLQGSLCWNAVLDAYESGAVIAASSVGAMALCEHVFEPIAHQINEGLGLLPKTCILPHHDMFGKGWVERLTQLLPNATLLGIDERTALINDEAGNPERNWTVYGQGNVTFYREGTPTVYETGQRLTHSFREQV